MELELKIYGALCATEVFIINGIKADDSDFGEHYDNDPDEAEPYGCGNMEFIPIKFTDEVLEKYKISILEYQEVQRQLKGLSFGNCGWCV